MKNSATNAKRCFSETVNRAAFGRERILLIRHGKPVAALVPAEDWERLIVLVVRTGHHRDVYR